VDSYEQTKYEDQEKGAENVEKKMSEKSDNEQNNNVNNMDSHSESQTINRTDKGKSLQKDNTEHDSHNTSSENKESVSQPQAGEHTEAEQECVFGVKILCSTIFVIESCFIEHEECEWLDIAAIIFQRTIRDM